MKKLLLSLILLITITTFPANAANPSLGVSPSIIKIDNLLRSGYFEQPITISLSSQDNITVTLSARGEIASWLTYPSTIIVTKNNPVTFKLIVKPPSDISNGIYSGFLRATTEQIGELKAGQATNIIAAVDSIIDITITDKEIKSCTAKNFNIETAEKNAPIKLSFLLTNEGNVRLNPNVKVDIWNQNQDKIIKFVELTGNEVLPSTEETINLNINNDLEIAQYWADIEVTDCNAKSNLLTFDIVEKGALTVSGILERIENKPWIKEGETVQIKAIFKNTGQTTVSARFIGIIKLDNDIIKNIQTEEKQILPGQSTEFIESFTPKKPGRYIASGKVFYENKQTAETFGVINVLPSEKDNSILIILIVIVLGAIIILLNKIIRERRK